MKLAVLGANGFIGTRIVELLHLTGAAEVRPIVRQYSSLARCARFDLDIHIADALDEAGLRTSFAGCDTVIHSVMGSSDFIVSSAAAGYLAAVHSGVRRFIYLSSASVHGQNPLPGTDETTALSVVQPLAYNTAKVRAERKLMLLSQQYDTELVILRPGIVFGPRSRWTAGIADSMLDHQSYLINNGLGICNSIYVDNLIEAIQKAWQAEGVNRQVFLVGDRELVTWADLYRPIAQSLGIEMSEISSPVVPEFKLSAGTLLADLRSTRLVQSVLPLVPGSFKRSLKVALRALSEPAASPEQWQVAHTPVVSKEMSLLQQCSYKFPNTRAERLLNYCPPVTFQEACRRSVSWLQYAGYPIRVISD